jgi:hypothetical protein
MPEEQAYQITSKPKYGVPVYASEREREGA